MTTNITRRAVIYCRVSDKKQRNDGDGLQSQEHRCRNHAAARGYDVEAVFRDDVSGAGDFMKRPGMVALLRFLEQHPDGYIVIFDDLKRFARDTLFHLRLRQALGTFRAVVECLNFSFEDTPEGQFVETVFAAQGELERLQNRRQVVQKMKARVERGYYVFAPPVGYRYQKVDPHGAILVRDEPLASIVRAALEGYAAERFGMPAEVRRWLEAQPHFPKAAGRVRHQEVTRLLTRSVYAGYVEAPKWGIARRPGRHEPLISPATFALIQDRLGAITRAPARVDINPDFPLRGAVLCAHCRSPLTAAWFKGKCHAYAYYLCNRRGCSLSGKCIPRQEIESEFEALLDPLRAPPDLSYAARTMFADLWAMALTRAQLENEHFAAESQALERQVSRFRERIAAATEAPLRVLYESHIRALQDRNDRLLEPRAQRTRSRPDFDQSLATALAFLARPSHLWRSGRLDYRRAVLKLTFAGPLFYLRGVGFRTPEVACPFRPVT